MAVLSPCCTSLQHQQAHRSAGLPAGSGSAGNQVPRLVTHGLPQHLAMPAGCAATSLPSQTGAGRMLRRPLQASCNRSLLLKLQSSGQTHKTDCRHSYLLLGVDWDEDVILNCGLHLGNDGADKLLQCFAGGQDCGVLLHETVQQPHQTQSLRCGQGVPDCLHQLCTQQASSH